MTSNANAWFDDSVAICRLEHRCVMRATGEDALEWLNNVTTQDLRTPCPKRGRETLFTDAHGRVRADAVVLEGDAYVDVLIPAPGAAGLMASLESRIVMEDVELTRPNLVVFSAQGPRSG